MIGRSYLLWYLKYVWLSSRFKPILFIGEILFKWEISMLLSTLSLWKLYICVQYEVIWLLIIVGNRMVFQNISGSKCDKHNSLVLVIYICGSFPCVFFSYSFLTSAYGFSTRDDKSKFIFSGFWTCRERDSLSQPPPSTGILQKKLNATV